MIEPTELAEALIGAVFVALGAGAVLLGRVGTPGSSRTLTSFGIFVALYGGRMLANADPVRVAFSISRAVSVAADAAITYWIVVPMGLLFEALLGRGRWGSLRRAWQVSAVYAAGAVTWDAVAGRPGAAMILNPVAVFGNITIALMHIVPRLRRAHWTAAGRALAAAVALFTVVAGYETLFGGLVPSVDVEPIAMVFVVAALGAFVASNVFATERRVAAMRHELETARHIQRSILPREAPRPPGLLVAARYLPTGEVAGDFYDLVERPDGGLGVLVADVSGHGVPAALIASMVKVAFAAEAEHAADPGRVLTGMNRVLCGKFERAYVTAVCGYVDASRCELRYAAAGHPPVLVRRGSGDLEALDEHGIVLGFDPAAAYRTAGVALRSGDRVLLYTDGLLEAERDGVFLGEGRLQAWLQAPGVVPLERFADALVSEARAWARSNDAPLADDLTLVVLEVV